MAQPIDDDLQESNVRVALKRSAPRAPPLPNVGLIDVEMRNYKAIGPFEHLQHSYTYS